MERINEEAGKSAEQLQIDHWGVGLDFKIRWQGGPQFGERQVVRTYAVDGDGGRKSRR